MGVTVGRTMNIKMKSVGTAVPSGMLDVNSDKRKTFVEGGRREALEEVLTEYFTVNKSLPKGAKKVEIVAVRDFSDVRDSSVEEGHVTAYH